MLETRGTLRCPARTGVLAEQRSQRLREACVGRQDRRRSPPANFNQITGGRQLQQLRQPFRSPPPPQPGLMIDREPRAPLCRSDLVILAAIFLAGCRHYMAAVKFQCRAGPEDRKMCELCSFARYRVEVIADALSMPVTKRDTMVSWTPRKLRVIHRQAQAEEHPWISGDWRASATPAPCRIKRSSLPDLFQPHLIESIP